MKKILIFLLIFALSAPCAAVQAESDVYFESAVRDGIVVGNANGEPDWDKEAARAEFLAMVVRFFGLSGGENVFLDVKEGDWFEKSISAAKAGGIFFGFEGGLAKPYDVIKTEDAVSVIGRFYNADRCRGKYSDVSDYAKNYYGYAYENGFFESFGYFPNPKRAVTKGEIVKLLYLYKEANQRTGCFAEGYPKLSENGEFNRISIELKLMTDCEIYYSICKSGTMLHNWVKVSDDAEADTVKTINISGEPAVVYDVYVKAVSGEGGRTQIAAIKGVIPFAYLDGSGTVKDPYVIYTAEQLEQIIQKPSKAYALGADIQINGSLKPVPEFSGSLDGNGYRITGLTISETSENAGLFGVINGGTVKNLTVDGNIAAKKNAGIICGKNAGGNIEGCTVTGTVQVRTNNAGGICGENSGIIKNCLSAVYSVSSGAFAGGMAGQNTGEIEKCLSAAETVVSDMYAGGISGMNSGDITDCAAVNFAVYNTMTYNCGRITTNRNGGHTQNNYSLAEMTSNAGALADNPSSQSGLETEWNSFLNMSFYTDIGWERKSWKKAELGFLLPCPTNAAEPALEPGATEYMPKKITNAAEFTEIANSPDGHYVLANDIKLNIPWKTVISENGFSGTLDGNGHTVYGLTLNGETGLFSRINGGTVKNISFTDVNARIGGNGAVITEFNYGYIENCTVTGSVSTKKSGSVGVIASENGGRIENCRVNADLTSEYDNSAIGGICAINRGVAEKCSYSGTVSVNAESVTVGGICGKDTEGYLSENFANIKISSKSKKPVVGGICGFSEDSRIYKCASSGDILAEGETVFAGGICASSNTSAVYNCFSLVNCTAAAEEVFAGGICGVVSEGNVQNTYSGGTVIALGNRAKAGGICGFTENAFVMQNVALNPLIRSEGTAGAITGDSEMSETEDNYRYENIAVYAKIGSGNADNGTEKSMAVLSEPGFYTKPLSDGGVLGWDSEAWTKKSRYAFPVLTDTPYMNTITAPLYK